jgi:arylformamidase
MENSKGWIDISVPLYSGMAHWPDNPPVRIERMMDLSRGDAANVSKIELGAHTGTHMDAPRHFLAEGAGIDEMPFDATIGPARVIRIEHSQAILPEELEAHNLEAGERVRFRTRNSERCWNTDEFVEDFVYIRRRPRNSWLTDKCARSVSITSRLGGMYTMASRRIRFS